MSRSCLVTPLRRKRPLGCPGCLLLPRALLLAEVRRGSSALDIAKKCGVSEKMAKYRMDVTGVVRQNQALLKKKSSLR